MSTDAADAGGGGLLAERITAVIISAAHASTGTISGGPFGARRAAGVAAVTVMVSSGTGGASPRRPGNAFLLAQVGAHAAARFAERIKALDLTPAQAGLLRLIAWQPGQSQQEIARTLGTPPSRLVLLVDSMEDRGLIARRRNPDDRRHHALYLTDAGTGFMKQLASAGASHEDDICAGLDPGERARLGSPGASTPVTVRYSSE